ncbi:hypothetical protein MHU86_17199 [Fragilaria crotonensis]|nr:hypothetical protein MHU86_17199 [Fragilaria crotonensis]
MGWTKGILRIGAEVENDEDNARENLIDHYGSITLERIIETEEENVVNHGREAQDTYMLYKCLMASLTTDARKKVTIWSSQYLIGNDEDSTCGGVAPLKIIIRESHLDTNATTNLIRTNLSNLDAYTLTVDSDILSIQPVRKASDPIIDRTLSTCSKVMEQSAMMYSERGCSENKTIMKKEKNRLQMN